MKIFAIIMLMFSAVLYGQKKDQYESKRQKMVDNQIIARGISDVATLRAMRKVPRHLFVPPEYAKDAYDDRPLPIGYGQTISQPYVVAYMTELVRPSKGKVALEIGTGSGYQAAVLAEIVDTVYTIEIVPELAWESTARFEILEYKNVVSSYADGYKGWPEHAPFDIIIVTAAADHIPQPLKDQLAENGRLVMPVGEPSSVQQLILLTKKKGKITETTLEPVRFVPLRRLK
jgi:protein-L-isoaspartate(D-aspartate) O-methyltransferase